MSPPSLHAVVDRPGDRTTEELLEAHTAQLAAAIASTGVEEAARAADLDPETVSAIEEGDATVAAGVGLESVGKLLAQSDEETAAEPLVSAALEELLFGMTAGVLNVDVVAGELDSDLDAREVQQGLEGRYPLTLGQYVELQQLISSRAA